MKKRIIALSIIILTLLIFSATYIRYKINEAKVNREYLLVQNLNMEAEQFLNKFIDAIEKGDYIKVSEMIKENPENYRNFKEISMKFLDKKVDREILNSHEAVPVYILKFQCYEEDKSSINEEFSFINGFYYITVGLVKEKEGWRVAFLRSGEYFN